ncbi:MAG: GPR endopeptidase [Clostridia bacterium]|nr:GPR endopeptidase [Clostridia bacterium]
MRNIKTDLAVEAHEYYVGDGNNLPDGIEHKTEDYDDVKVTVVDVTNENGKRAIGKSIGTYITIEAKTLKHLTDYERENIEDIFGQKLRKLLEEKGVGGGDTVLVAGLGNNSITPDALGPQTVEKLDVTRHIMEYMPDAVIDGTRPVCAIAPGVLGNTGIETIEIIKGVVEKIKPAAVIAIDALASRSTARVGTTIQISDTGIEPGAGVGNRRKGITEETLDIPVIAVGVPTVIDAATIADDAVEQVISAIKKEGKTEYFSRFDDDERYKMIRSAMDETANMMVTPKEVDTIITDVSAVLASGINKGLHD